MAHRRHRSRRRLQHFLPLLVMASTSSALSLSNFQVITSNQIPRDCISAYQSDIDGCKRKDFMNGRQCSSDCVQGLEETANLVKEACGDLNVSPGSLLGIVLSGGLVNTLCPGSEPTTVVVTVQPSSTKGGFTTLPTTSRAETTKTSKTTQTTSSATLATTSTSTPTTSIESTTDQETTSTSATSEDTSTSSSADTSSTLSTAQSTVQTTAQTTGQSVVTSQPSQTTTSDDSQDAGPTPFIGGSPFDPAPIQNVGRTLCLGHDTLVLASAVLAAILMLR